MVLVEILFDSLGAASEAKSIHGLSIFYLMASELLFLNCTGNSTVSIPAAIFLIVAITIPVLSDLLFVSTLFHFSRSSHHHHSEQLFEEKRLEALHKKCLVKLFNPLFACCNYIHVLSSSSKSANFGNFLTVIFEVYMMNAWNLEYLHINITSTFTQNVFVVMWLLLW